MRIHEQRRMASERGFTLIELVVAAAFMGIVVVALSNIFLAIRQINRSADQYTIAVEAAQQQMETERNTAYSSIPTTSPSPTPLSSLLNNYPSLGSPRSASMSVSYINTDGTSAATDVGLKRVNVTVNYTDRTGSKNVQFETWIANKGLNP